ncbi:hypothetical protein AXG93_3612s1240 [Marchantia polymorpha subsp. ruderalis]|uniref:Uncharacterized protein n=1 Tax=Marchantia polymorpha subsp. ruderalis TaxID=1480154 RepID=A0A176WCP2_MARPO|nr:hypothetical protein AXG93_3612s1240 [Marchantia polymorpha subsp. ruderalis]
MAIFQILKSHRTSYMTSWQVGFVELALASSTNPTKPNSRGSYFVEGHAAACDEEKGGSVNHLSSFLINFYRSMGCLTAEGKETIFLVVSDESGKFVKDVEVDTDLDEVSAITPPGRPRAEKGPQGARAPRKRKFCEMDKERRRESLAVPVRLRATNEQTRPKQKARKLILTACGNTNSGRASIAEGSPSSEDEDGGTEVLERPTELPAPKAHMPSEEELRLADQRDRLAATARVPVPETFLPSEQVPSEEAPSVQRPFENNPTPEGKTYEDRNAETRVPFAEGVNNLTSAEPEWEDLARPTGVGSPTPLEMLTGYGVEAAAEEAARPSARESPRCSAATEILELEEETHSEEEEVESVQGTPTGVLCEQVDQWALTRKLQKAALKLRDEMVKRARHELDELRAKIQTDISVKHVQIRNLTKELVRKTQALEESEAARRADEELLGGLQSQCEELRA